MPHALRLNLGTPEEQRSYYAPHFIAERAGFFAQEGLSIAFQQTRNGGDTAMGGQIGAVADGSADIAVGGPMVVMKLAAEGRQDLRLVAGLVRANPWCLAAAEPQLGFALEALRGRRVRDIGRVHTATLCAGWVLRQAGLGDAGLGDAVTLLPGTGDAASDIAAIAAGSGEVALHSLHALAPHLEAGRLSLLASLAAPTGPVPWSAYVARADRAEALAGPLALFRRAMQRALALAATAPPEELARLVAADHPGHDPSALAWAFAAYRRHGIWSSDGRIPAAEVLHFGRIMQETGWLPAPPDAARLIAPEALG